MNGLQLSKPSKNHRGTIEEPLDEDFSKVQVSVTEMDTLCEHECVLSLSRDCKDGVGSMDRISTIRNFLVPAHCLFSKSPLYQFNTGQI